MIRINLLPDEYRRRNRTSFKLVLAVAAMATFNGSLLAWLSWMHFGIAGEVDSERSVLQTELDGLTPQVTYNKALDAERKRHSERESVLAEITKSRISWTRKVDELISVIHAGGEPERQRHHVWLDDLIVQQTPDPRSKSAGSVRASGHNGSDRFDQIANFLDDLEHSPFIEDFLPPAPPEGSQTLVDKELIPPVVWAFPLSLSLKTPEERVQRKAAAKEAKR